MDVFAHVPIFCKEKGISYVYVKSRHELGAACQTRRPISLLMVLEPKPDSAYAKTYEQVLRNEYAGEVPISTGMTTKDEIEKIVEF